MIKRLLIALAFTVCLGTQYVLGQQRINLSVLTNANGLSQNTISCIYQDRFGLIWFGTHDGLNMYDGYKITVYKHTTKAANALPANHITAIGEDAAGNLWVGTRTDGVSRFDRAKETFTNYRYQDNKGTGIKSNNINCIYLDQTKNLWIGTANGLNRFDQRTGKFNSYNLPGAKTVYSLLEDDDQRFWIGTDGGLYQLDKANGKVTFTPDANSAKTGNSIYALCEDQQHQLLLGTEKGLKCFSPVTRHFSYYAAAPDDNSADGINPVFCLQPAGGNRFWLGTNTTLQLFDAGQRKLLELNDKSVEDNLMPNDGIYSMLQDRQGILWIGTTSQGVLKYDKQLAVFPALRTSLSHIPSAKNIIRGIAEDRWHNLYLATDAGLSYYDRPTCVYRDYVHHRQQPNSLLSNYTTAVLVSRRDGHVWIGTYSSGLDRLNPATGQFVHYTTNTAGSKLSSNYIDALLEDKQGHIWIATDGGGLNKLDPATSAIKQYWMGKGNSVCDNTIDVLYEDKKGRIWIGGYSNGISIFDPLTETFTALNSRKGALKCDVINAFYEDRLGQMWIGTMGGGLSCYNERTGKVKTYTEDNGLINNTVNYITGDALGFIWLTTNQGVVRLDAASGRFKNFNVYNGLKTLEFCLGAGANLADGSLAFGSINGFNVVNPASLVFNSNKPAVVFTGLDLFNKPVSLADKGSPLSQSLLLTKEVSLDHRQSMFTFNFAALDYSTPAQNNYAYQLEGFDKEWRYVGNQHRATYTNLNPGSYRLLVKASNNDGVWSEQPAVMRIIIEPPYWLTWWFRGLAVVATALCIYLSYRYRVRFLRQQKAALEVQVSERTRELEKQKAQEALARAEAEKANKAKSTFLATMSHEIRTPMNGVLGMASLLAETRLDVEQKEYTDAILSSGESLLNVINDVLDFSKIESGHMELDPHDFDLRKCVEDVLDLFAAKTAHSGVDLLYQFADNVPVCLHADSFRLKQVLLNLVSNAVKFTAQGEIFIGVHIEKALADDALLLCFEVRDTGIGIPPAQLANLFTAFNQLDSSITRKYGGSGLGLAICDRLIKLMGGIVQVKSSPGNGSTFSFTIKSQIGQALATPQAAPVVDCHGKKVLLVDDNPTNLRILQTQLNKQGLVTQTAYSGRSALDLFAANSQFDLLITDRQMPDIDGVEFSKQIKLQHPTLPIVLLSSIGDEQKRQQADLFTAVLTKPVRQQALLNVVFNVLQQSAAATEPPVKKGRLDDGFSEKCPFKILVAEDNMMNQKLIMRVLNKLGYQPDLVADGEEVLEKLTANTYDLILMDVQMPKMDGLQATRIIRQQYGQKPLILALTANALSEDRDNCFAAGMDGYLSKPLNLDQLVERLTALYQQHLTN